MKICFLSLNSYPLLTNINLGYVGGAEVEQTCLAKELAHMCYDISFVTYYHGLNKIENIDKIQIIKTYERDKVSKINVIYKYASICSALDKANADIYFYESGSPGVLPLYNFFKRKKVVYRIPTDAIVLGKPISDRYTFQKKIIDIIEIKKANTIIVQNELQKRILKERYKINSIKINNGFNIPKVTNKKHKPSIILWVATMSSVKRPHLFIELAKCLPNFHFEMIGGKSIWEPQLYDKIRISSEKLSNLKFHGFVSYKKINKYFQRASIFVNTSMVEGFPNTFIQSWLNYTPVVSLNVDPDNIIKNEKLGFYSGNYQQLVSDVITLLNNDQLREIMGKNARKYAENEFNIKKIVKEYIKIFNELI